MSDNEDRREKRLARDRENARERRKRKKTQVESLQKNVTDTSIENRILQDQNSALCGEVVRLRAEVVRLNQTCNLFCSRLSSITNESPSPQMGGHQIDLFNQAMTLNMNNRNDSLNNLLPSIIANPIPNLPSNTSSLTYTNATHPFNINQLPNVPRDLPLNDRQSHYLMQQQLGPPPRPSLPHEHGGEVPQDVGSDEGLNPLHNFYSQNSNRPPSSSQG